MDWITDHPLISAFIIVTIAALVITIGAGFDDDEAKN